MRKIKDNNILDIQKILTILIQTIAFFPTPASILSSHFRLPQFFLSHFD
ncbi:MAG: hypothetical protein AB1656_04090 [Candidatus Omnitrophota bacterium]